MARNVEAPYGLPAMLGTIIIGVDGRQGGRDALALGKALGDATGASVVALHIYPREPFPTWTLQPDVESLARQEAETFLREEVERAGVHAEIVVSAHASPGSGMHQVAQDRAVDLVIVGPSHRGAVGRVLAGDTVRAVLQGAQQPVAVARDVQGDALATRPRIGVGFDGSPESREALAWAGALGEAIGAPVHVVVAVEPPQAFTPSISYGINWVALEPEREGKAGELVAEATAALGGETTGEVVLGVAYQELTELSKELDLLVLGSRAYGPVRRTLLGSTSDRVVHAAACPVVVVPRGHN